MGLAQILQLFTILEPQVVSGIIALRNTTTKKLTLVAVLDSVDAEADANTKAISDWLAQHP